MRTAIVDAVILIMCLCAGVLLRAHFTQMLVVAGLCTIIVLSIHNLPLAPLLKIFAWSVLCIGACCNLEFSCMLPIVAYGCANNGEQYERIKIRYCSYVAIAISVFYCLHAFSLLQEESARGNQICVVRVLMMMFTVMGAIIGNSAWHMQTLMHQLQRTQDRERQQTRTLHRRINSMQNTHEHELREAALGERMRIAREIHDNVGHVLTRAIMQTSAARVVAQSIGECTSEQQLATIEQTVDEAMTMVRKSVHDLADRGTDFASLVQQASSSLADSHIEVSVHNTVREVPAPIAHCFTATIREALTNIQRHSKAQYAMITIRELPSMWQLSVQDNGGNHHHTGSVGIGVIDIEERARALGGNAVCGPYGAGWRVFVSIPKRSAHMTSDHGE